MIFRTNTSNEILTQERCYVNEILNSEGIGQVSIAQARVKPGVTTQLHQLSVDETYYILQGRGLIEIGESKKREVGKGDVVFIKAGKSQRITNTLETDLLFLCICTPRFVEECYISME